MSKVKASSKLLRPTAVGKPSKRSSAGSSPPPAPPVKESSQEVDADLTRALKQIFEVRKIGGEESVTVFGKKLSNQESDLRNSLPRQGSDKLPQAATAHLLKELHKQRLRQRGITATVNDIPPDLGEIEFVHTEKRAEVSTMPLLNCLQDKRPATSLLDGDGDGPEPKRQRVERDESVDLSLSICSSTSSVTAPNAAQDMEIAVNRSEPTNKNVEQLTLFYNGSVYVYDDVPSDKAKAIMVLASSISSRTSCYSKGATPAAAPKVEITTSAKEKETHPQQARKQSIQRFLGLRRDRLNPKAAAHSDKEESSSPGEPGKSNAERSPSSSPFTLKNRSRAAEMEQDTSTTTSTTTTTTNSAKRIVV